MNNRPKGFIESLAGRNKTRKNLNKRIKGSMTLKRYNNYRRGLKERPKRYFSPNSIFYLKGHGADMRSGEYRLKPNEYLMMSAECGMPVETTQLQTLLVDMRLINDDLHNLIKIPIPEINTNLTEYKQYKVYNHSNKFEMFRPKLHNSNNPAYYKIPAIQYQPLGLFDYENITGEEFKGVVYKGIKYTEPLRYFELGKSGIITPKTFKQEEEKQSFSWEEDLIRFTNGIESLKERLLYTEDTEFELIEDQSSFLPDIINVSCLFPVSSYNLTLDEAYEADPLSRRFVEQLISAFSASVLTIPDIAEMLDERGEERIIINFLNFTMSWDEIFEFVRSKAPTGPLLVIHPVCRNLPYNNDRNRDNVRFPRTFEGNNWRNMTGKERRKVIKQARLVNPREESDYTSE